MNAQVDGHKGVLTVHITSISAMSQHTQTFQEMQKSIENLNQIKYLIKKSN